MLRFVMLKSSRFGDLVRELYEQSTSNPAALETLRRLLQSLPRSQGPKADSARGNGFIQALTKLLDSQGIGAIGLDGNANALWHTVTAERWIDKYFPEPKRFPSRLPASLAQWVGARCTKGFGRDFEISLDGACLTARFMRIRGDNGGLIVLSENRTICRKDLTKLWRLTHREMEVLRLLVQGFSYPKIGMHLSISARTVHAHVQHIFDKMGVSSRHVAARMVQEVWEGTKTDLPY